MKEGEFILKHRIHEIIGNRKVNAALFYTFNFDPKFFENYVMPLLVPDQAFTDNAIANNILWRKLYKDQIVPTITVYYDEDVKSIEHAPLLDYDLVPVNMPMVGKNKGNFHPKQIFILLENPDMSNELLILTGSNNLTFSGWCENVECISEQILINGKFYPREFRKEVKEFIDDMFQSYGKDLTLAEDLILGYLSKILFTKEQEMYLYSSRREPFHQFLLDHVLEDDTIKTLEIISPYFSSSPEILLFCKDRGISVKIQAPIKDGYCLMDKTLFQAYRDYGIQWFEPDITDRNNHSKIYRFYGSNEIYTIIGSINLTDPAWSGYAIKPKKIYNIESAVMYIEKKLDDASWLNKKLKDASLKFIEPGISEETWHERIEIPEIRFTINWLQKTLRWKVKAKNKCKIRISASQVFSLTETSSLKLSELKNSETILRSLSRKPILEVLEQIGNTERSHYYYANQENFEQRPLEFRLSATDILEAWDLLSQENSNLKEWLVNRLELVTHLNQDESGKLLEDRSANKSLLNEMSRHFYGLVKLEEFLFNEQVFNKSKGTQSAHINNLNYYLTNDNVDTLISYQKDLKKLRENEEIMSVFYWLILNIILNNFYQNKVLNKMLRGLYTDNTNMSEIRIAIAQANEELKSEIDRLEKELDLDRDQLKWGLSILKSSYGIPG